MAIVGKYSVFYQLLLLCRLFIGVDALHCGGKLMCEYSMKKIIIILPLMFPVMALAFPFEVEKQFNGAEIAVDTLDLGNNMASVSLNNYGSRAAVCKVRFRNGPEAPRTRKARIAGGETAHLTARFNSTVIKMRVQVECKQD